MELKSKDILKRKPNLKLCSNHYKPEKVDRRWWRSAEDGTAVKGTKNWYMKK